MAAAERRRNSGELYRNDTALCAQPLFSRVVKISDVHDDQDNQDNAHRHLLSTASFKVTFCYKLFLSHPKRFGADIKEPKWCSGR